MGPAQIRWVAGVCTLMIVNGAVLNRRHDGSTFSETTRMIYRVDTHPGRCAFVASLIGFGWHILKPRT